MADNDFPAQKRARLQWQLDVIRENQFKVSQILILMGEPDPDITATKMSLSLMHKNDRDAILQSSGILTDEQIELLK